MSAFDHLGADWPAISAWLDQALALPPSERAAWLDALPGDITPLKATLQRLLGLQAALETDDFLLHLPALPANRERAAAQAEPAAGSLVGPYRLVSEVGRGGMGVVWRAERADGQLKWPVALKLPRLLWGDALAERLARERDILASLAHPNIARLLDAGVDAHGRPYLALEFVEGLPIDAYCREHALSVASRVALLLQVAAAVAHAHARLVVHRDLKPANILVASDGKVHLLDFGIAKLLEGELTQETALTRQAGRALTLDYASPEQIRGEPLGAASDVYSLAVVAYEVLSGSKPYRLQRGSAAALEEAITQAEPPLASASATDVAVKRRLQGDVDAILNHALKKQPGQRYATMEAFALDLQRHLASEPVQAQPDTLAYRAGKFVSRYRLQVVAAGFALSALLGGAGLAFWQAHEARQQADLARTEAATARAVQAFIETVFRANSGDQADPEKARNTTARELLDLGAERITTELRDSPQARLRLLQTLAQMYRDMTLLERAAELQQQRVALARDMFGASSPELAEPLADRAYTLGLLDRRKDALAEVAQATALLDAAKDHASPARFKLDLTQALLYQRTDAELGLQAARRALANARARAAPADIVSALSAQADLAVFMGDAELARASTQEAIERVQADPALGANRLSPLYVTLGNAQHELQQPPAAKASFLKALEIARSQNGIAPIYLHTAARQYANFLRRNGQLRESVEANRPGYEWGRSHPAGYGVMPATLVVEYGRVLIANGRVDQGLAVLDEAQAMSAGADEAPEMAGALLLFRSLGLIDQGRFAEARSAIERTKILYRSTSARVQSLQAYDTLLLSAQGLADEALRGWQAARTAQGKAPLPTPQEPARTRVEAARLLLEAGRVDEGKAAATQVLAELDGHANREFLLDVEAGASLVLGRALLRQQQPAAARELLLRSLALHKRVYDPARSLAVSDVLGVLARAQTGAGDAAAARLSQAEAATIQAANTLVGPHHRTTLR